jgi:hypothetical protein
MNNYRKVDLAYMAGIIDGEGSISFTKDRSSTFQKNTRRGFGWRTEVKVSNTDKSLFRWITRTFPSYGYCRSYYDKRVGIKRKHEWCIRANDIREFLPVVTPFLKLKKTRAELILEALDLISQHHGGHDGPNKTTPNDDKLEQIYRTMKKLNSKGIADAIERGKDTR